MSNNISESSEFPCSGCGACAAICPEGAIQMVMSPCGFLEASVDTTKCVECALCKKVCTRYDSKVFGVELRDTPLYAMQSMDQRVVASCSSGGIAHELSRYAVENKTTTVGVAYDYENNGAIHKLADTMDEISAFKGSKYLQSNPQEAFRRVLELAKDNHDRRFLVFGTPCQITGLAKCCDLLQVRNQFLLVEIFCHGVPPDRLWQEELRHILKKLETNSVDSIQFRYKKYDWHSYCIKVDSGEKSFYGSREKELFWQVYFENILLNDACFSCRMRKSTSSADIRIGDYWGKEFQSRSDGVSAAFACTESGEKALKKLVDLGRVRTLPATDAESMLSAQNMNGYSMQRLHDEAMESLKNGDDIRTVVKTYRKQMCGWKKVKHILLRMSTVLPDNIRMKMKKAYSAKSYR